MEREIAELRADRPETSPGLAYDADSDELTVWNIEDMLTVEYDSNWVPSEEISPLDGKKFYTLTHVDTLDFNPENLEIPLMYTITINRDVDVDFNGVDDFLGYYEAEYEVYFNAVRLLGFSTDYVDYYTYEGKTGMSFYYYYEYNYMGIIDVAGSDDLIPYDGHVIAVAYSGLNDMYYQYADDANMMDASIKFL